MIVLGIETSCDDTGVAIYDSEKGLISHSLYSQADIHSKFGGVVPELASRNHIEKIIPLLYELLSKSSVTLKDIDAIAYTAGPGLAGALIAGATFAKSLAYSLSLPAIGVNHMEGHLLAPLLDDESLTFPFVALLVSGGHTMLVAVEDFGVYRFLGESLDDAAGEAFDKVAKMLFLPYPGGPHLSELAKESVVHRFLFPRPMLKHSNLNFSFSGLKTFALNTLRKFGDSLDVKRDIAYAFEEAVVDTLILKSIKALKETKLKKLLIAGGVSANKKLRERLKEVSEKEGFDLICPKLEFCTDNGAMPLLRQALKELVYEL